MTTRRSRLHSFALRGTGIALFLSFILALAHAQRADQSVTVAVDNDDIGGVVTSDNGPEAGVWVIAETHDLPVRYIKIVVTDDLGRYLIPDLPRRPTASGCAATVWWTAPR